MNDIESKTPAPHPTGITIHTQSRTLDIAFDNGMEYALPFEFLRVYSPSAEVKGHAPGQEVLQTGKRNVEIVDIEAVGNYAVRPAFSDDHDTGIYSWDYLFWLGVHYQALWEQYLERLEAAGFTRETGRDAPMAAAPASGHGGCGH
jgi:DUF971 family protein